MHDGTTPLMLAVRLAVEGMVEELINADADVNATDAQGMIAFRFLPRDAMHSADCCRFVCLSVRLSVTCRYSIGTRLNVS